MKRVIIPIFKKCKVRIECLKFQMINIKDESGELIRYRIPRKDLFLIQDKIINSEEYKSLHHETWNQGRISNYLTKGVAKNSILDEKSAARIMFVIQVLHWHMQKNAYDKSIFVINKRPWFSVYNEYAAKYNIDLLQVNIIIHFSREYLNNILRSNIILYGLARYIKYKHASNTNGMEKYNYGILYIPIYV